MKKYLSALLLFPLVIFAQKGFKPGKMDKSLMETICPYDSSAGAFYIYDYGETGVSHNYEIQMKRVVRLKILNKSEFSRADISIPHWIGNNVIGLKAFTYNIENGEMVTTKVEKDAIFKEKVNENYSKLNFTFPDVKEGSVIEYSYKLTDGGYSRLKTWYFQASIPVLHSEYHVRIPEYFDYQRLTSGYHPLEKGTIEKQNGQVGSRIVVNDHHYYLALNVPAFKSEPYMASKVDIIMKIDFELRSIIVPGSVYKTYLQSTFKEFVTERMKKEYWSNDIKGASWAKDFLETINEGSNDEKDKANRIFDYVKKFEKSDESSSSLRACFKDSKGTDHDLNRTLISVLREAGFEVDPVWISTRSHGRVNPSIPMRKSFNFVISRLKIGDESYLLDASEKEHVFGVLPKYCLNGKGLVMKEGSEEWVVLEPYKGNNETVQAKMELSEDGILSGDILIRRKGYEAWEFDEDIKDEGEDDYIKEYEQSMENWSIESHEIDDMDDDFANQELITCDMEGQVEDLGNVLYLNPVIYGQYKENPYKTEKREYPVSYGAPFSENYVAEISIPDGFVVETIPEPFAMAMLGKGASINYSITQNANKLLVMQRIKVKRTEFSTEEYPLLREFYARIVEKNGEQIVLKRL